MILMIGERLVEGHTIYRLTLCKFT